MLLDKNIIYVQIKIKFIIPSYIKTKHGDINTERKNCKLRSPHISNQNKAERRGKEDSIRMDNLVGLSGLGLIR